MVSTAKPDQPRVSQGTDLAEIEHTFLTLLGDRDDNQDRGALLIEDGATLLLVIDGMGGHAAGESAAETAVESITRSFQEIAHPVFDPQGFLHGCIGRAHDEVVRLGEGVSIEAKPRATCAICLVQDGAAFWAHVGDSRVYQLRNDHVLDRTRDHSHVEVLLREGLITEEEIPSHPMRNFVECCLGGDAVLPDMSVTRRKALGSGDVLLVCTDGLWSGLDDAYIGRFAEASEVSLEESLRHLGKQAVAATAPYSDNTTAAAIRWPG